MGPSHVDAVRPGGYADVVAVAGFDPDRTAARAASLGVGRATTSVEELLRDHAAIAGGRPPPETTAAASYPTLGDGARGLAFIDAVLTSAGSERWVPVSNGDPP